MKARWSILALVLALASPASATVNTGASSTSVLGNGSQTQFAFGFIAVAPAYITVLYTDPAGNQSVIPPGQYQLALNAPVQGSTWGVGGTLTYSPSGGPIPSGATLTIARTLPLLQAISLQNQASYGAIGKAAEQASDLLEMQLQQTAATQNRSIVANIANSSLPAPLPPAAQAAGSALCFDSSGNNVIACRIAPAGIISSALAPVVGASSPAAAFAALGAGAMAKEGIGAGIEDDGAGNARTAHKLIGDTGNTSVTASFHQTTRAAFGPLTYALPEAGTLWNGFGFWIYASGGPVTLSVPANDNFFGQASGASATILAGSGAYVVTNGAVNGLWLIQYNEGTAATTRFPGEVVKMRTTTCPNGTMPEDGRAVSRITDAALFASIGTTYGQGDGSTTFLLPYSGGVFDRGWLPNQSFDTGRAFGSLELDQLQNFTITYQKPNTTTAASGSSPTFFQNITTSTTISPDQGSARFGTETRPVNIPVLSCIVTGNSR